MATTFRVAGWKAEGLRCPDHEFSFLSGPNASVHPVTVIQMPNGTGKTTTLELLRAAMSGSAARGDWDKKKILSLRKRGSPARRGSFQLTLLVNDRRLTIALTFDFEEGRVWYQTTFASGQKDGFDPPRDVAQFLRPEFVRFFVFDGELAEQLLSHEQTKAQAVIDELFQLSLLPQLSAHVQDFWNTETARRSAKEERGFTRRRNRVTELRARIAEMKEARANINADFEETKQELLRKKNKFNADIAKDKELNERLHKADVALSGAKQAVEVAVERLADRMRDPFAVSERFAVEMVTLKASLDRVKLPESTAREFFEELAQEQQCVCGRALDDSTRKSIRERAKQYLGSDDVMLLNHLKSDVAALVGAKPERHDAELRDLVQQVLGRSQHEGECKTTRDRVVAEAQQVDPGLEQVKNEMDALAKKCMRLEADLEKYDALDATKSLLDAEVVSIRALEHRLADAEQDLAEVTDTLTLKQRRDILVQILDITHRKARTALCKDLCTEANQRIATIMPHNAIRIREIDQCLMLQDQEGGSVGETLSVGYAFLATLFDRAEHHLPFVVDSPANPIDLEVRGRVAELIPKLTGQFIAFTISSEREGFVPPLHVAAGGKMQYLTMFRKGPVELEATARAVRGAVETSDGLTVPGREFFSAFQLDTEGQPNGV